MQVGELEKITTVDEALVVIRVQFELITKLEATIVKLEEKIACLEKNSKTSSKPPSSDIVKPKEEQRQPGKRKIGGQKGHIGFNRELLPESELDRINEIPDLTHCPSCRSELDEARMGEKIQQTAELVLRPIEVVEHRRNGHYCSNCGEVKYPELPPDIVEGQCLGLKLQGMASYFKGVMGASFTEISNLFEEGFNFRVSRGALCAAARRMSECLSESYQELKEQIPQGESYNIDESGWKKNGKGQWLWLFCNKLVAFFYISDSRGCRVLEEILGANFPGRITSDFFSAYRKYNSANQQYCLAHLIRDIKFLVTLPDENTKLFGKRLIGFFRSLFRLWHRRGEYTDEEFQKKVASFETRLKNYLARQSFQKGKALTMQKRLFKHWKPLFRFLHEPTLYEPTNNSAEQALRPAIRIRRQTQGSRSDWGVEFMSQMLTVVGTCRKHKRSPWEFILDSLRAATNNSPAPSLIPVQS